MIVVKYVVEITQKLCTFLKFRTALQWLTPKNHFRTITSAVTIQRISKIELKDKCLDLQQVIIFKHMIHQNFVWLLPPASCCMTLLC